MPAKNSYRAGLGPSRFWLRIGGDLHPFLSDLQHLPESLRDFPRRQISALDVFRKLDGPQLCRRLAHNRRNAFQPGQVLAAPAERQSLLVGALFRPARTTMIGFGLKLTAGSKSGRPSQNPARINSDSLLPETISRRQKTQ